MRRWRRNLTHDFLILSFSAPSLYRLLSPKSKGKQLESCFWLYFLINYFYYRKNRWWNLNRKINSKIKNKLLSTKSTAFQFLSHNKFSITLLFNSFCELHTDPNVNNNYLLNKKRSHVFPWKCIQLKSIPRNGTLEL